MQIDDFIKIRKHLHQNPEISGNEQNTSKYILSVLKDFKADKIIENIGGYGIAALFYGTNPKLTIGFRAELDALPIKEINLFEYKSVNSNVSHKCGHDGHMANLLRFAYIISQKRENIKNNILIIFQPAEETAQGAKAMLDDKRFASIKPDYIFGLHNLPGYPLGSIIFREKEFASASVGLKIELEGKTSHAGHPENGNSPVLAMTSIINGLLAIPSLNTGLSDAANITIIHSRLGEIAFGTSPGEAVVMATLRAANNDLMSILKNKSLELANGTAGVYNLKMKYEWVEDFAATINNQEAANIIKNSANKLQYKLIRKDRPFPWSEDFGYFSKLSKTGFFGIGSGEEHPQLHNPDYDYPDELIFIASEIFYQIVQHFEKLENA
jgi:amidohydrolase